MKTKLRKGERCPIHGSYFCCGRESQNRAGRKSWQREKTIDFRERGPKWQRGATRIGPGTWKIPDEHHARGYRIRLEKFAMKALLDKKIKEQDSKCGICGQPFDDYRRVVPDHILPKGMGGCWWGDHESNIQAVHNWPCNMEKGSQRI